MKHRAQTRQLNWMIQDAVSEINKQDGKAFAKVKRTVAHNDYRLVKNCANAV